MCIGQPSMEWEQRHLDRKGDGERSKQEHSRLRWQDQISRFHSVQYRDKIERTAEASLIRIDEKQGDDRDQHQQAAECRKDKEFNRRIDAIVAAPDADEEKHRDKRRLEEQVKDKQIQGHKNADHGRLEEQQKDIKRRRPSRDRLPRREHRDRHNKGRQYH